MDRTTYVNQKGVHWKMQERLQEAEQWRLAETARGVERQEPKGTPHRLSEVLGRSWASLLHVGRSARA